MSTKSLNDIQEKLERHLINEVNTGEQYFKSKYIAEALDVSPKVVGTNMGMLQDKTDKLEIESWSAGGSTGITWLVAEAESNNGSSDSDSIDYSDSVTAISDD